MERKQGVLAASTFLRRSCRRHRERPPPWPGCDFERPDVMSLKAAISERQPRHNSESPTQFPGSIRAGRTALTIAICQEENGKLNCELFELTSSHLSASFFANSACFLVIAGK
eukprot:755240-Hanusia_phi.AAC.3